MRPRAAVTSAQRGAFALARSPRSGIPRCSLVEHATLSACARCPCAVSRSGSRPAPGATSARASRRTAGTDRPDADVIYSRFVDSRFSAREQTKLMYSVLGWTRLVRLRKRHTSRARTPAHTYTVGHATRYLSSMSTSQSSAHVPRWHVLHAPGGRRDLLAKPVGEKLGQRDLGGVTGEGRRRQFDSCGHDLAVGALALRLADVDHVCEGGHLRH